MELIKGMAYGEIEKPNIARSFMEKNNRPTTPIIENKHVEDISIGTGITMDFSGLNNLNIPIGQEEEKPKRKKQKGSSKGIVVADDNKSKKEESYSEQYVETNAILKSAIAQIDIGLTEMKNDLDSLRKAKTMKNKHQYISLIQGNMGNYIGQKISAARELNNTITKCNEMEFKRAKEMKMIENQDDDKAIMDMYNALISTPVGGQTGINTAGLMGPTTMDMTFAGSPVQAMPNIITGTSNEEAANTGYQNYMANRTPAQNLMFADANPNIQQVYVYNKETGQSYFDVIDVTTGESHPEIDRLDASFLEDTHPDFNTGVATNTNIGESYPIITIGNDSSILSEY